MSIKPSKSNGIEQDYQYSQGGAYTRTDLVLQGDFERVFGKNDYILSFSYIGDETSIFNYALEHRPGSYIQDGNYKCNIQSCKTAKVLGTDRAMVSISAKANLNSEKEIYSEDEHLINIKWSMGVAEKQFSLYRYCAPLSVIATYDQTLSMYIPNNLAKNYGNPVLLQSWENEQNVSLKNAYKTITDIYDEDLSSSTFGQVIGQQIYDLHDWQMTYTLAKKIESGIDYVSRFYPICTKTSIYDEFLGDRGTKIGTNKPWQMLAHIDSTPTTELATDWTDIEWLKTDYQWVENDDGTWTLIEVWEGLVTKSRGESGVTENQWDTNLYGNDIFVPNTQNGRIPFYYPQSN